VIAKYIWHKNVTPQWLEKRDEMLQTRFGTALSIIDSRGWKRIQIQIACRSEMEAKRLIDEFGGRATTLSHDWLERFSRAQATKAIKIGKRLVVSKKGDLPWRAVAARSRQVASAVGKPPLLVIPAGAAFGTGDHPTTAMSLRLLEQLARGWRPGWSLVDLGTGSGIFALAAKKFGAGQVIVIDIDPMAISVARSNSHANKLHGVQFLFTDAHSWKPPGRIDILIANLFSELVIELLPKFQCAKWLILSGILRAQERQIVRALERYKIGVSSIRRRGKWIALLARNTRFANL